MTIAEKLYKLRNDTGLSQKEFSDKIGASQSAVNYWENGNRQPRITQMKKIAKTFDIALYILLDDTYPLPDITSDAWKNRARFSDDTEMETLPQRFTTPANTKDTTLNVDEQQARFEWINERLSCGKNITKEDEKFRWEYMKQSIGKIPADTAQRIQSAYNQLNQEGKLKAADQIELLTRIPEYQKKPNE